MTLRLSRLYALRCSLLFSFTFFFFTANAQTIGTVAGNGTGGYSGDDGAATAAELNLPNNIAFDAAGNMYIADEANYVIREVNTSGVITTVAGNNSYGYSGDGGAATAAELSTPSGMAFDAAGNLYIIDQENSVIRKVDASGIITTVAGNNALSGDYSGDGGPATAAGLNYPSGIAFDNSGNLYIADHGNSVIREVDTSGIISTVVGTGSYGYSGDGGPATAAQINQASAIAFDAAGNLYIADAGNNVIREVNTSGIISTIAGNGTAGYSGDGAAATAAELSYPYSLAFDESENLFVADAGNDVIREIDISGNINTIAGNGTVGYSGDGGPATAAEMNGPLGISFDGSNNLYIADQYNNVIRSVSGPVGKMTGTTLPCPSTTSVTTNTVSPVCSGNCVTLTALGSTGIQSTGSYQVATISYAPFSFTAGTSVPGITADDMYSDVISLPFNFCFFGSTYNQCVIGDNGQVSFNASLANGYDPWDFTGITGMNGPGGPLPGGNTYATLNSIMGAYYDLDPHLTWSITTSVYGSAPCRLFVVSWSLPLYDGIYCPNMIGVQQIVLHESTNQIDVFIQKKPLCTHWNNGLAILGIENSTGTFYTAPGKNCTQWNATNVGFSFIPNQSPNVSYTWYDQTGAQVGTGASITVCPPQTTTYTVDYSVNECATVTATANVTVSVPGVVTYTAPSSVCSGSSADIVISGTSGDIVSYTDPSGAGHSVTISGGIYTINDILTNTGTSPTSVTYVIDSVYDPTYGCKTYPFDTINIIVNPVPDLYISGNDTICSGTSYNIPISGSYESGITSLTYNVDPGGNVTTTLTTPYINTGVITASGGIYPGYRVYTLLSAYSGSCTGTASGVDTVWILPKPYAVVVTDTFCEGDSLIFSGTPNTLLTYSIDGSMGQHITLDGSGYAGLILPPGSYSIEIFSAQYSSLLACDSTLNDTYNIQVNPAPYASIPTYDTLICNGAFAGNIPITGTPGAHVTYTIDPLSSGSTTLDGAGQGFINTSGLVSTSTFANTCYTITLEEVVNDTTHCFGAVSGTVTVCVRPTPYAQISYDTSICNGDLWPTSFPLNITGNFFSSVSYTLPDGTIDTVNLGMGGMASPPWPSNINTGTTPLTYTYTLDDIWFNNAPQCVTPLTGSITLTVYPTPTATITPTDTLTICNGTSPSIVINGTGTSVKYTISGVGTFTQALPATLNPLLFVSTNPSSPTEYIVTLDSIFNPHCPVAGGDTLVVWVLPPAGTTASVGNSPACAGAVPPPYIQFTGVQGTYTYYTLNGVTDTVYIPGGGTTQVSIVDTNTGTTTITDTLIVTGAGYGYAPYCDTAESDTVYITIYPLPIETISTPGNVTEACDTITLTANPAVSGDIYTWYFNGGGGYTSIQSGTSNTLFTGTSGNYYVVTQDGITGCIGISDTFNLTIDQPITVNVAGTACGPIPFTLSPVITGGNLGATYSYSWTSSPTDPSMSCTNCLNPNVSPTVPTEYAITVTDPASTCPGTTAVADVIPSPLAACVCTYDTCQPAIPIGVTGSITSDVNQFGQSPFCYIDNDVTISNPGGEVTIWYTTILIAPGVHIYVDKDTKLNIISSHLFACGTDMWAGITLKSDTTTASAQLSITSNTLIEDATAGVTANYPVTPAAFDPADPTTGVLYVSEGLFNRNTVGIAISNYGPNISAYPFYFTNSVFCSDSLNLYATLNCQDNWPFSWQESDYLHDWSPTPPLSTCYAFTPPSYLAALTATPCHNGSYPTAGIQLKNVGLQSSTATTSYPGIILGDTTFNGTYGVTYAQLIFANMHYGIRASNSNMIVGPDLFFNINLSNTDAGIYDSVTNDLYRYSLEMPQEPDSSKFYDCATAVSSNNNYVVDAHSTYIASSHYPSATLSGHFGFRVQSSRYRKIDVSDNGIYNVTNGIAVWSLSDTAVRNGKLAVSNNNIAAAPLGCLVPNFLMKQAISVRNLNSNSGGMYLDTVDISNNMLTELDGSGIPNGASAYNGIYVSNYNLQHTKIDSNTVYVYTDPSGTTQQFGIEVANCIGSQVYDNFVYGPGATTPTPPTLAYSGQILAGVYSTNNQSIQIGCNHTIQINTGFQFYGTFSTGVKWHGNIMDDGAFGLVLDGLIGQQGNMTQPSDNEWGVYSGGYSWTGSNYQTLVWGTSTDAANSTLYVRNATGFVPTNNNVFGGGGTNIGYTAPGTLYGIAYASSSAAAPDCLNYATPSGKLTGGGNDSVTTDSIAEKATQQRIDYTGNIWRKNWQAQYAVWRTIAADSTQTDSSNILQQFWSMSASSRFNYLAGIEQSLANGDTVTAQNMLNTSTDYLANTDTDAVTGVRMADDTAADVIVTNYRMYYKLYLHYMKGSMSSADSAQTLTMAQLCPMMNGAVVYQARALYSLIYDDLRIFDDVDCDDTTKLQSKPNNGGQGSVIQNVITDVNNGQRYSLYPNPTDGLINLQQAAVDNNPVKMEILNGIGQTVYASSLEFETGHLRLEHENMVPGVYLMKLEDSEGRVFILKFVIENKN